MSGRAGRRGLDENGIVMVMIDEKMEPAVGKALVKVSCPSSCFMFCRLPLIPSLLVLLQFSLFLVIR